MFQFFLFLLQIWMKDSMIYTDLFGARLLRQKEFPVTTSQIHLWLANPAAEDDKPLFDALKGRNTSLSEIFTRSGVK